MTPQNIYTTLLTIAYFAVVIVGFQSERLSETETKLLMAIGLVGIIIIFLLQRREER